MRLPAVPGGQGGQASVLGIPNARFRPESDIQPFEDEARAAGRRRQAHLGVARMRNLPPLQLLATVSRHLDAPMMADIARG